MGNDKTSKTWTLLLTKEKKKKQRKNIQNTGESEQASA